MLFFINSSPLRSKETWLSISTFLLLLYLLPLFIYKGDLHVLVFDNLDSNIIWFKILAESGKIFASNDTVIPNMMGGLPRSCYGSEFNIIVWLYYFFTPLQAYIINEVILHSIAFISMYIFLDKVIFKNSLQPGKYIYISIGALYFSTLPFWPSGGLSVPIMPLIVLSLIHIQNKQDTWKDWLLLIFLPLYSEFIIVYFFFFFLLGIYICYLFFKTGILHRRLLFALILSVTLFLLREYRLVLQMFIEHGFISNRTEYFSLVNKSFWEAYRNAHIEFINGLPHAKGIHFKILLPTSFFALLLQLYPKKLSVRTSLILLILFFTLLYSDVFTYLFTQKFTMPVITVFLLVILYIKKDILSILLLSQIIIAYWFGFSFYQGWEVIFQFFPKMEMFNFSRFFFLSPFLWALIAVYSLRSILQKIHYGSLFAVLFMFIQFYIAVTEAFFNTSPKLYYLPFNKYYASSQFKQIQNFIKKPLNSYRIVSLGIDPSVSLFNGFYTLDGYIVNYPLTYKHQFRKIIATHLGKNAAHHKLFDGWGSKVYLFDNNVGYSYKTEQDIYIHTEPYTNLELNTSQIYAMGGRYLLSSRKILNENLYDLYFEKVFISKDDAIWKVWLYRIDKPKQQKKDYK
nr:DUF6044 family protein [Sulfurovum indicum]